ncbi:MAG TPA: FecR domain-containing protein [Turneriella sp.]|nr:FecR domain-containing protein [Turneriella sp.]
MEKKSLDDGILSLIIGVNPTERENRNDCHRQKRWLSYPIMRKIALFLLVSFTFFCKEKGKPVAEVKVHAVAIVFVSGTNANVVNASGTKKAVKGALVNQSDRIITGAKSVVDLLLPNKIVVRIDQNTTVEMRTLTTSPDGAQNDKLYLQRGLIFAKVAKLGQHSTFAIQTPTVVAGVRGTEFMTASDDKGGGKVAVTEGRVAVQSGENEHAVNAGEQASVDPAGKVSEGKIDADTLAQMKQFTTVADARAEMTQMLDDAIRFQQEALERAGGTDKVKEIIEQNDKMIQEKKAETQQKIDAQKGETTNKIQEMKQGTDQKKDEMQNSIEEQRKKRDELFNKNKFPQK